jgi:hypothetical protein
MQRFMVRRYHIEDCVEKMTVHMAQEELALRLLYEVVFGFIAAADVTEGRWLQRRLRNYGHHKRMLNLWSKAKCQPLPFPWICPPVSSALPFVYSSC